MRDTSTTVGPERRTVLPPGPRLPAPLQTALLIKAPHRWLPRLRRRYGDTFRLRLAGMGDMVIVTDPAEVRQVFSGPPELYYGNPVNAPVIGERSMVVVEGKDHLRLRRLLTPAFGAAAVQGYDEMFERIAAARVARWPTGRPFSALAEMENYTQEIFLRVILGIDDERRHAKLRGPFRRIVNTSLLDASSHLRPGLERFEPWRGYAAARRYVRGLMDSEIAARRRVADVHERRDLLSRLVATSVDGDALSDAEIRDQLMTLMLAGNHTTSTTLGWAFHELVRHPAALRAARAAAERDDEDYLDAVVNETMRLRPPLYQVIRRLKEPARIGAYVLPAEVTVSPAVGLVQRDGRAYGEPDAFRPERFLEGQPGPGSWIPFGGGVRRCPGSRFAMAESAAILKAALRRFELRPAARRPERVRSRNILLIPSEGARIVARPVGAAGAAGTGGGREAATAAGDAA
ncbi:cytochrome P450 [Streptomyces sp. URMC 123]|uniref:cytochrome P450 n=1 Tax=Streptomyces sp. URMC 123 TaxID=3423403 RepID=UPI003F19E60B